LKNAKRKNSDEKDSNNRAGDFVFERNVWLAD
jgi:hypothetical protein